MKKLIRTTEGYFLSANDKVYRLQGRNVAELVDEVSGSGPDADQEAPSFTGDFLPPVEDTTIVLVGLNYPCHAKEVGADAPTAPIFGAIPNGAEVATGATVSRPSEYPDNVDYEGELAVIIGKACSNVSEEEASSYVFGVTPCIDLAARDMQMAALKSDNPMQVIAQSKAFPGFKPIGPEVLITDGADLLDFDLKIDTFVNGDHRQNANTSEMVFSVPALIAAVSSMMELKPGDVICTGSPAGVGMPRGEFLQPGDKIELRLGDLTPLTANIA